MITALNAMVRDDVVCVSPCSTLLSPATIAAARFGQTVC
jgi:hypothetical protein